jgi:hypothetical protein
MLVDDADRSETPAILLNGLQIQSYGSRTQTPQQAPCMMGTGHYC